MSCGSREEVDEDEHKTRDSGPQMCQLSLSPKTWNHAIAEMANFMCRARYALWFENLQRMIRMPCVFQCQNRVNLLYLSLSHSCRAKLNATSMQCSHLRANGFLINLAANCVPRQIDWMKWRFVRISGGRDSVRVSGGGVGGAWVSRSVVGVLRAVLFLRA